MINLTKKIPIQYRTDIINLTKIKDVMTKKFKTIDSMTLAIDAAEVMETNKIFTLVVMSGTKNVGVLSMHDLIQARIL